LPLQQPRPLTPLTPLTLTPLTPLTPLTQLTPLPPLTPLTQLTSLPPQDFQIGPLRLFIITELMVPGNHKKKLVYLNTSLLE
jgi:hypothetical protein